MSYKNKPLLNLYQYKNNSFELIAIVDDYESCSWERNKYEAGQFTITINYNIPNSHFLEKNLFVQFGNDPKDFGVIESVKDNISSGGKGSQIRTVTGYDVRYLYKRRIIKNLNDGSSWAMTDSGEVVMRNLIDWQCGSKAENKRKLPIVNNVKSTGIGSKYSVSEAYSNLYEVLVTIATQSEIGWYVSFTGTELQLGFYSGEDKSESIQFSTDYETLNDGEFSDSSNSYSNAIYVGGKGNNDDRDIYEGENVISGSSPSGLDRFESWTSESSMTNDEEYKSVAESVLSQYSQTVSVNGNGLAKSPYIYKEQYDVGDLITISFSGKTAVSQILSVTEYWANASYQLSFSFGKPQVDLSRQLQLILNKIHTAEIEQSSRSIDSVKYYTLPGETEMPESDVTYGTIGFKGDIGSGATFKLYFKSDGTGAKTYHLYFRQLGGSGKLTITTGVSGKETLVFNPGTYVAIIYVDDEGNVKSGSSISDSSVSKTTSWSSQETQNKIYDLSCSTNGSGFIGTMAEFRNFISNQSTQEGGPKLGSCSISDNSVVPATWYNYLYIPHRDGFGGDNYMYGTLLMFYMTNNYGDIIIQHLINGIWYNPIIK